MLLRDPQEQEALDFIDRAMDCRESEARASAPLSAQEPIAIRTLIHAPKGGTVAYSPPSPCLDEAVQLRDRVPLENPEDRRPLEPLSTGYASSRGRIKGERRVREVAPRRKLLPPFALRDQAPLEWNVRKRRVGRRSSGGPNEADDT